MEDCYIERRKKTVGDVKFRDHLNRKLEVGETQRKDGRYRFTYVGADGVTYDIYSWKLVPTDVTPKGKRDKPSLRELEKEIKLREGIIPNGNSMSLIKLIDYTISTIGMRKESTMKGYQTSKNFFNRDIIGAMRIDKISSEYLKIWIQKLAKEGQGFSNINAKWKLLKLAFDTAVKKHWLFETPRNFALSDYIFDDTNHVEAITEEERDKFLEFIKNDKIYSKYYDEVYLLFKTGLRLGEFVGLSFEEIDFENKSINLSYQIQGSGNQLFVTSLKGKVSKKPKKRQIPMYEGVEEAFKRIIEKRPKVKTELIVYSTHGLIEDKSGFLFLNKNNRPRDGRSYDGMFERICSKYNQKYPEHPLRVTPHVCRHTFASILATDGYEPLKLAKVMGHESIDTALKFYVDLDIKKMVS